MKRYKTPKTILKELEYIEKANTSLGLLDFDSFAEQVLVFMDNLKKEIKKEKNEN